MALGLCIFGIILIVIAGAFIVLDLKASRSFVTICFAFVVIGVLLLCGGYYCQKARGGYVSDYAIYYSHISLQKSGKARIQCTKNKLRKAKLQYRKLPQLKFGNPTIGTMKLSTFQRFEHLHHEAYIRYKKSESYYHTAKSAYTDNKNYCKMLKIRYRNSAFVEHTSLAHCSRTEIYKLNNRSSWLI